MTDNFSAIIALPTARLGLRCDEQYIQEILFLPPETPLQAPGTTLAQRFAQALTHWLDDPAHDWSLPRTTQGSAFQQRVWSAIARIPPGQTRSYGALSAEVGGTPRAIGQACGANPLPLMVPCHRVVSARGLGGFAHASAGWLIETKQWLLRHEGAL